MRTLERRHPSMTEEKRRLEETRSRRSKVPCAAAPPIVFIMAHDDRVARERACRAGAVDKTLLDAINRAIRAS